MLCRPCAGPATASPPTVAEPASNRVDPAVTQSASPRGSFLIRWWRHRTLRARITLLATVIFAVALILAGRDPAGHGGQSLLNTLDSSAERTGTDVAALVNTGKLPQQVLAGSGGPSMVQVVDGNNQVIAASPGVDTAVSMVTKDELARLRAGQAPDRVRQPGLARRPDPGGRAWPPTPRPATGRYWSAPISAGSSTPPGCWNGRCCSAVR